MLGGINVEYFTYCLFSSYLIKDLLCSLWLNFFLLCLSFLFLKFLLMLRKRTNIPFLYARQFTFILSDRNSRADGGMVECMFAISQMRKLILGDIKQFTESLYRLIRIQSESAKALSALCVLLCISIANLLFLSFMVNLVEGDRELPQNQRSF